MARPQVADGGTACRYGEWLRIYGISSRGQSTRDGPPAWGLGDVVTTPHHENLLLRTTHKSLGRRKFLDCLRTCQLLRKASAAWSYSRGRWEVTSDGGQVQ